MAGHVTSLRQRERDILIQYNDGTFLTTIQPVEDVERAFAAVNQRAIEYARQASDNAVGIRSAADWWALAESIDSAPKVEPLPAMRMAAE